MSWSVVESFVESKHPDRLSEDLIVVSDHFAAVVDGASDATGAMFAGRTGGLLAAEAVAATVEALEPAATARQFAAEATAAVQAAVAAATGIIDASTRWPAACVVCLSHERSEIWRIGDAHFAVDGETNSPMLAINEVKGRFRAALNTALIESGTPLTDMMESDPGGTAVRALTDVQQHLSNLPGPWGYGCVNGRAIPDEFVEVFPVDGGRDIVLASDGYPRLEATLDDSEATLRRLLAADPAAIGELWTMGRSLRPGFDAIDDRAFLRLRRDA